MEGNRKMRGCLQTFGGHCISTRIKVVLKKDCVCTRFTSPGFVPVYRTQMTDKNGRA